MSNSMVALPSDEADVMAKYLATNFPVRPAPEAVVIPGPVVVSIREWMAAPAKIVVRLMGFLKRPA